MTDTVSAAFILRFQPTSPDQQAALLRISSNDPDEARFELLLNGGGADSAPQITAPGDLVMEEDGTSAALSFTVTDAETRDALVVSASSSNSALTTSTGILLSGTGASRSAKLTPLAGASGTAKWVGGQGGRPDSVRLR